LILANNFKKILEEQINIYSKSNNSICSNLVKFIQNRKYKIEEKKNLVSNKEFCKFFKNEQDWNLKIYYYRYEKLKLKGYSDFLDEKEKMYIEQRGALKNNASEIEQFNMKDHLKNNFLSSDEKVFLIVGLTGSGKSIFTQSLENEFFKNRSLEYIPIWINLTKVNNPSTNLLNEFFESVNINKTEYEKIREEKILFILDGFDEINIMHNIYNNNKFDKFPLAKIVITCREDYFNTINIKSDYLYIFSPNQNQELVSLCYLMEFNSKDKEKFIENTVLYKNKNSLEEIKDWDKKRYLKELNAIDPKNEYTNNPFNLNILCSILPKMDMSKNKNITRFNIFNTFMNIWFKKEFDNIQKVENIPIEKIFKNSKKSETEGIKEILEFSQKLAVTLLTTSYFNEENKRLLCIDYSNSVNNPFQEFFEDNLRSTLFRKAAPLKRLSENQFNFIHKSIMEYLIASYIIKELESLDINNNFQTEQSLLNKFILFDQPAILKFTSDYFKYEYKFDEKIFNVIYSTRNKTNIDLLSSNCATLLNYSSKNLIRKNFNNTRIPYADFRSANLINSTFVNCNLSHALFNQANISYCEFLNTDLTHATTGRIKLNDHNCQISSVKMSNDNRYLISTCFKNSLIIYSVSNDFNKIRQIKDHTSYISSSDFSNDNKYLATGSDDNSVIIYDINNNFNKITQIKDLNSKIDSLEFSKDSKYLFTGGEDYSFIYDAYNNFKILKKNNDHSGYITAAAFSYNNKYLVTGATDNTVIIYDVTNNFNKINQIKDHTSFVFSAAFSSNNKYLCTGSNDKSIIIYDVNDNFAKINQINDHSDSISSMTFSKDNKYFVSASRDTTIILYDVNFNFNKISQNKDHSGNVSSVSFSSDNKYLISGSWDNSVIIHELNTYLNKNNLYQDHSEYITSLTFSKDNRYLASGSYDKSVIIYDVNQNFTKINQIQDNSCIISLDFSKDNKYLAVGREDCSVTIYDINNNFNQIKHIKDHVRRILSVKFSNDNKYFASGCENKKLIIYDMYNNFNKINEIQESFSSISSLAFSDDNKYLVCGSWSGFSLIYDINNNFNKIKEIQEPLNDNGYRGTINSVAFSNDCKYFVTGWDEKSIIIYDVNDDFNKINKINDHDDYVKSVAFSKNNKYLVTGSGDRTIIIYDVNNNFNKITRIQDHNQSISVLTFSYDSKYLVTASLDKSIIIYDVNNNFNILYCKNNTSLGLKFDSINFNCTMTSKYFKNFK